MRIPLVGLDSKLVVLSLLVSFAAAQQTPQEKPLGDVAREQKIVRQQSSKTAEPRKVVTDEDVASESTATAPPSTTPSSGTKDIQPTAAQGAKTEAQPTGVEKEKQPEPGIADSVLDRPKDTAPDVIIVPAGTELRVDIDNRKIVVPVRIGFATPIPALSQVAVHVSRTYINGPYVSNPYAVDAAQGVSYVDYVEYATVTSVTVDGRTYEVQTNSLPLAKGPTNSEMTFILDGSVAVAR